MRNRIDVCLLVSIVAKGWGEKIISAAKSHGASSVTTILGRGIGKGDAPKILGLEIEPEQEVVLVLIERGIVDIVMNEINDSLGLDQGDNGVAFIVPIEHLMGLEEEEDEQEDDKEKPATSVRPKVKREVADIWPDPELAPRKYQKDN